MPSLMESRPERTKIASASMLTGLAISGASSSSSAGMNAGQKRPLSRIDGGPQDTAATASADRFPGGDGSDVNGAASNLVALTAARSAAPSGIDSSIQSAGPFGDVSNLPPSAQALLQGFSKLTHHLAQNGARDPSLHAFPTSPNELESTGVSPMQGIEPDLKAESNQKHLIANQQSDQAHISASHFLAHGVAIPVPDMIPEDSLVHAAIASRLPISSMSPGETVVFGREFDTPEHLPVYLDARNRILRAFHQHPTRSLSLSDALAATGDHRADLCISLYHYLVRHSYINYGLLRPPVPAMMTSPNPPRSGRARTFVVIGAGVAGLTCARQLRQIFEVAACGSSSDNLSHEPPPQIIVVEARQRVGGRVYTHPLYTKARSSASPFASTYTTGVDLGAKVVTGWEGGNPIKTIIKKQLRLTTHDITKPTQLYDTDSRPIPEQSDVLCELIFNQVLEETSRLRGAPVSASNLYAPPGGSEHEARPCRPDGNSGDVDSDYDPTKDHGNHTDSDPEHRTIKRRRRRRGSDTRDPSGTSAQTQSSRSSRRASGRGRSGGGGDYCLSLGQAFGIALRQHPRYKDLTERELRVIHWHLANLEFANATTLDRLSLQHWDQDDEFEFFGHHSMVVGGYGQVAHALAYGCRTLGYVTDGIANDKLDVRLGMPVNKIEWHTTSLKVPGAKVHCEDGTVLNADAAILTVPLGVLQSGSINFSPELPKSHSESVNKLGFGVLNKVVLVFREAFWDVHADSFGFLNNRHPETNMYETSRGKCYLFWNMTPMVKLPVLIALLAGDAAIRLEQESDQVIVHETLHILQRLSLVPIPAPLETIVTRWSFDEYSRGSYSFMGINASGDDYDKLAAPLCNSLYIAGEHTCREYPATVHGAILSGMRVAAQIGNAFLGEVTFVPDPSINRADFMVGDTPKPEEAPVTVDAPAGPSTPGKSAFVLPDLAQKRSPARLSMQQELAAAVEKSKQVDASVPTTPATDQPPTAEGSVASPTRAENETPEVDGEVKFLKKAKGAAARRRKNEKDKANAEPRQWWLLPPKEWTETELPLPCPREGCEETFTVPTLFHEHLISHMPEAEQAAYHITNENGQYPSLPEIFMPAPPKQYIKNAFLLYLKVHWESAKRELQGDHHYTRTHLGKKWGETPSDQKKHFLDEIERMRVVHSKMKVVFERQSRALGVPQFKPVREIPITPDLAKLAKLSGVPSADDPTPGPVPSVTPSAPPAPSAPAAPEGEAGEGAQSEAPPVPAGAENATPIAESAAPGNEGATTLTEIATSIAEAADLMTVDPPQSEAPAVGEPVAAPKPAEKEKLAGISDGSTVAGATSTVGPPPPKRVRKDRTKEKGASAKKTGQPKAPRASKAKASAAAGPIPGAAPAAPPDAAVVTTAEPPAVPVASPPASAEAESSAHKQDSAPITSPVPPPDAAPAPTPIEGPSSTAVSAPVVAASSQAAAALAASKPGGLVSNYESSLAAMATAPISAMYASSLPSRYSPSMGLTTSATSGTVPGVYSTAARTASIYPHLYQHLMSSAVHAGSAGTTKVHSQSTAVAPTTLALSGSSLASGMPSSYLMYQTAHRLAATFETAAGTSATSAISAAAAVSALSGAGTTSSSSASGVVTGAGGSVGGSGAGTAASSTPATRPTALQSYYDIINSDGHYQQFLLQRQMQQQQHQQQQSQQPQPAMFHDQRQNGSSIGQARPLMSTPISISAAGTGTSVPATSSSPISGAGSSVPSGPAK